MSANRVVSATILIDMVFPEDRFSIIDKLKSTNGVGTVGISTKIIELCAPIVAYSLCNLIN